MTYPDIPRPQTIAEIEAEIYGSHTMRQIKDFPELHAPLNKTTMSGHAMLASVLQFLGYTHTPNDDEMTAEGIFKYMLAKHTDFAGTVDEPMSLPLENMELLAGELTDGQVKARLYSQSDYPKIAPLLKVSPADAPFELLHRLVTKDIPVIIHTGFPQVVIGYDKTSPTSVGTTEVLVTYDSVFSKKPKTRFQFEDKWIHGVSPDHVPQSMLVLRKNSGTPKR